MNGNQVLHVIKTNGFEKGVTECLLRIAEETEDNARSLKAFASAFEQLVTVQGMMNGALDGMKEGLDRIQKHDDDPSSTRGMVG